MIQKQQKIIIENEKGQQRKDTEKTKGIQGHVIHRFICRNNVLYIYIFISYTCIYLQQVHRYTWMDFEWIYFINAFVVCCTELLCNYETASCVLTPQGDSSICWSTLHYSHSMLSLTDSAHVLIIIIDSLV